jgi:hypothetical protein
MNIAERILLASTLVFGFSACSSDDDAGGAADAAVGGQAAGGSTGGSTGGEAHGGDHHTGGTTGGAGGEPVGGAGGAPVGGEPVGGGGGGGSAGGVEYVCPPPAAAGGEDGGGGEAGGGGAGGAPAEENVPCATECGRLADCATDPAQALCPCYEPAERDALYAGCYETCTGPDGAGVLAIAQGQATCDGLVNIIKTLNPNFKAGCIGSPAE